mgnify:FL=1
MRCRRCGSTEVVLFKDRHRCSVCDSTNIKGASNHQSVQTEAKVSRLGFFSKIFASLLTAGFFYYISDWFGDIPMGSPLFFTVGIIMIGSVVGLIVLARR